MTGQKTPWERQAQISFIITFLAVLFPLLFVGWFLWSEKDGLVPFSEFILGAVTSIPTYLQTIFTYYQHVSTDALLPSVVMGLVVGGVLTGGLNLHVKGLWQLPPLSGGWVGLAIMVILVVAGLNLWLAIGLAILAVLGYSAVTSEPFRQFFTPATLQPLTTVDGLKVMLQGLGVGALAGGIGSQLLLYPTQHCTYAPEVVPVQFQMGLGLTLLGTFLGLLPAWTVLFGWAQQVVGTSGHFRGWATPYILLLPNFLFLSAFLYYPATQIVTLSLKKRFFPLPKEEFDCLSNYVKIAEDPIYLNSFRTTGFITLALVVITMTVALMIATLASQKVQGASIYRTLLIWPYALSPVVSGVIFLGMFREGGVGVVNAFLNALFNVEYRWLRDQDLAPWVVIAAAVWNSLGFNILFYIAGLQNVPKDLLEAAAIDGANVVQRFVRITLPLLSPFTFFLLISNITYAFYGVYGAVDALTQGGPPLGAGGAEGGATNVLIYNLYEEAFGAGGSSGEAAAQALVLFLLVAGLTLLQFRYVESRVTYGA